MKGYRTNSRPGVQRWYYVPTPKSRWLQNGTTDRFKVFRSGAKLSHKPINGVFIQLGGVQNDVFSKRRDTRILEEILGKDAARDILGGSAFTSNNPKGLPSPESDSALAPSSTPTQIAFTSSSTITIECNQIINQLPDDTVCLPHAEVKPFACFGACGEPLCFKSYATEGYLKRHCLPKERRTISCPVWYVETPLYWSDEVKKESSTTPKVVPSVADDRVDALKLALKMS
ncbi:hypothetical protein CPB86DRAFT_810707 [Serendipita vermifera]|nr:hypothetical protein CPB86DRAFT_810707 [Serendipita vermifera]